ncbi:MAG: DUF1566 domain-containing protein [Treponema sp.]|nr:DUF1566 domain-containing protein [Treponema sp.]
MVIHVENHRAYECSDVIAWVNWEKSKEACKKFRGGGFSDWYLPSLKELAYIYDNLKNSKYNFPNDNYWSSEADEKDAELAMIHDFPWNWQTTCNKGTACYVIAIRSFKY